MAERVTITRIADLAGVSKATVDRVLNDRPGVHPRTQNLVLRAASELGLEPDMAPMTGDRLHSDTLRKAAVILPAGTNAFIDMLETEAAAVSHNAVSLQVVRAKSTSPDDVVEAVMGVKDQFGAVALVALDVPVIHEVIRDLQRSGKKVIALASPLTGADFYIGTDNRVAGRLAGQLLGRFVGEHRSGVIGLFGGNVSYRGHEEREAGFRAVLGEDRPDLSIRLVSDTQTDDPDRFQQKTRDLLAAEKDLVAIYNIGGGNRGIAKALQDARRLDVVFIGHDLTAFTRRYLLSGVMDLALVQSPADEIHKLIQYLAPHHGSSSSLSRNLSLQVILRENLP